MWNGSRLLQGRQTHIWRYYIILWAPQVRSCLRGVGQSDTFKLGDDWGLDCLLFLLVPFLHHKHPPETISSSLAAFLNKFRKRRTPTSTEYSRPQHEAKGCWQCFTYAVAGWCSWLERTCLYRCMSQELHSKTVHEPETCMPLGKPVYNSQSHCSGCATLQCGTESGRCQEQKLFLSCTLGSINRAYRFSPELYTI